jgi:hypothetical protein
MENGFPFPGIKCGKIRGDDGNLPIRNTKPDKTGVQAQVLVM